MDPCTDRRGAMAHARWLGRAHATLRPPDGAKSHVASGTDPRGQPAAAARCSPCRWMTRTPRPRRPGESSPSKLTSPGAWPRRARRGTAAVRRAPPAPSPTPLRHCRRPPLRRRGARVHCGADDGRAVALAVAAAVERLLATAESPISPGSPSYMRLLAPLVFQTIPRHHSPHTNNDPNSIWQTTLMSCDFPRVTP